MHGYLTIREIDTKLFKPQDMKPAEHPFSPSLFIAHRRLVVFFYLAQSESK